MRLLLLLALSACLVGCPKEGPAPASDNAVELWTMQLKPTFTGYMTDLIAAWEQAHPGKHVNWVDLPASEIENKTLTAAASGHSPDLVNLNPAFANKLANVKGLLALPIDAHFKDQYFEAAWQANTVDGQIVGLPWYLSTSVTLFNKELWQQAGLKEYPSTWQGLAEASRVIKAKTEARGFMPNFGDRGKFMEMLASEGIGLLSADRQHAAFNTPAGVGVLEFWAGLIREGVVPQECLTQGHREAIDRFQAGQSAVFPAGPQFLKTIKENSPQLYAKIDVGPQISGGSGKVGIGVMNLVIPSASAHKDLALDLGKFIVNGPNQLAFCKLVPILPSEKGAAADPFFHAGGATLEERARAIAADQLQRATLLVPPLPHQNELAKALDDALQRAALGIKPPAEALRIAAEDWDRVLSTP
jgi:putative chitobiose transport system substrate-binding protein